VRKAAQWLRAWAPAIGWAIVIFWGSTDALSSEHTSRYILPFLHWLLPHASSGLLEELHEFIRKTGHFSEYFVFSLLLLHAVRGGKRGWSLRWAIAALIIAAGYSMLDEFHQSLVPGRGPSPWDSLLDTCSAATAQVLFWAWFRARRPVETAENGPRAYSG
jgi:VanZ family protein